MRARGDEEGLPLNEIVVSVFRAYRNALRREDIEWDELDEDQHEGWARAVSLGNEILDNVEDLAWPAFAGQLFEAWAATIEFAIREFADVDQAVHYAWIAAAKHLVNLCAMEPGEDLEAHEKRWLGAAYTLGKPTP